MKMEKKKIIIYTGIIAILTVILAILWILIITNKKMSNNYNNKTSNIENKNGLNKAINSQENNSHEINHCNTFKKNSFTKFPSKIFFNCDSQNNFDNIFIFKLFLFAFRKNQNEFPRNLFFVTLNRYSLEELKRIGKTNVKYIDK